MPDPVKGEDVLVKVDDGASTMLTVEHQGDAQFNTGVDLSMIKTKTGFLANRTEAGETITFSFRKVRPLSTGQARVYALHDSGELIAVEYDDPNTGGHKVAGDAHVVITGEQSGVDDVVEVSVTLAFESDATRTVNA